MTESRAAAPAGSPGEPREATRDAAIEAARRFGATPADFARLEQALAQQSGGAVGPGDAFWALSSAAAERYSQARDWDGAGIVYHAQARWLHDYEPDHHYQDTLRLAHSAAVLDLQKRRHHRRVAIDSKRCCTACAERDGEEFSFQRALQEAPLPFDACERDWCSCTWRGIPLRGR